MAARTFFDLGACVATSSLGLALSSCGPAAFDSQSVINTVRILASSASEPYAKPGDTVTINVLAVDERPAQPTNEAMKISWIPFVCADPTDDLYYDCFAPGLNGSNSTTSTSGGTTATTGLSTVLKPGVDLTSLLPSGPSYSFTMPTDIITKHVASSQMTSQSTAAANEPYGLVILFNAACAGHLEYVPPTTSSPQGGVPLACYDANGNVLGSDDFVFGVTRVYSYADRTNANPVITSIAFNGKLIDFNTGITMPRCTATKRDGCDDQQIVVNVPTTSAEPNPADIDNTTNAERHEQVYAAFFASVGDVSDSIQLLYDPEAGRIPDSIEKYKAPNQAGDGTMWVVVHDNRGGAAWQTIPLHIQ